MKPARTDNIHQIMLIYCHKTGLEECDRETATIDLLADLMHLGDEYAIDFYAALHEAERHYDAEKNEES